MHSLYIRLRSKLPFLKLSKYLVSFGGAIKYKVCREIMNLSVTFFSHFLRRKCDAYTSVAYVVERCRSFKMLVMVFGMYLLPTEMLDQSLNVIIGSVILEKSRYFATYDYNDSWEQQVNEIKCL